MDAKSKSVKALLYLFLILLSTLCFTPFWLMIVNATRTGNEIMTGFSPPPPPIGWPTISSKAQSSSSPPCWCS